MPKPENVLGTHTNEDISISVCNETLEYRQDYWPAFGNHSARCSGIKIFMERITRPLHVVVLVYAVKFRGSVLLASVFLWF